MNIQNEMAVLIKDQYAIPREVTISMFEEELLTEQQCRKVLIRNAYLKRSTKLNLTKIKEELANKYA